MCLLNAKGKGKSKKKDSHTVFRDSPYKTLHPIERSQWICNGDYLPGFYVTRSSPKVSPKKNNIKKKKKVAILMKNNNNSYGKCFFN